jgi:hypothetical protein
MLLLLLLCGAAAAMYSTFALSIVSFISIFAT